MNTLTIGTISVFYSHLEQQDQNNIGRFFSLKPDELKTILQVLTLYRNACDIVNIGLHFFLKNVRPYAASCSEA